MFSPLLRNRLSLFQSYITKKPYVAGGPVTVTVESTAKCNLSCPMCLREKIYFPPRDMELWLFRKIIDEGKGCLEFAAAYGAGEPLLNPELTHMIAHCRSQGIPAGISTNATVLSESLSHALITSGLNCIIFAFDGATRESYQKYRKGSDFDKARDNILTFLRVKKRLNSDIFCILQMVRLKDNQQEVPALIRMWRVEGMNEIRVKMDEVRDHGCRVSTGPYPPTKYPCNLLWRGPMYIHYDGTVFPCCYIFPTDAIGNVRRNTLREIWNSERMVRLRSAHIRGDLSQYEACRNCPAARPRLALAWGSFFFNMYTIRKAIPFFERLAQIRKVSIFETMN